jgi:hypothetical protein
VYNVSFSRWRSFAFPFLCKLYCALFPWNPIQLTLRPTKRSYGCCKGYSLKDLVSREFGLSFPSLKGSAMRDFRPSVFFSCIDHWLYCKTGWKCFVYGLDFPEIFANTVCVDSALCRNSALCCIAQSQRICIRNRVSPWIRGPRGTVWRKNPWHCPFDNAPLILDP